MVVPMPACCARGKLSEFEFRANAREMIRARRRERCQKLYGFHDSSFPEVDLATKGSLVAEAAGKERVDFFSVSFFLDASAAGRPWLVIT